MVVHEPGEWFDEVLDSLGDQDYPNLSLLFLVTGEVDDVPARIRHRLPAAHVRAVPGNPGFGPAANQALRLVEGSGFFCLLHDDVALRSDTIGQLVEELYRSNAGVVGPKLVSWDDDRVLQHVGFGVDRFGELDPFVEPGEVDQEQHDAVRDVFCLPSACVLIRADLFRSLGGFHPGIDFHGEDLDLCWRAHLSGARVLVVPAAVARHREQLRQRRPDLHHRVLAARHRVHNVATLTGRWRTPFVMFEALVLSILQTVMGVFTGRLRSGIISVGATLGALLHLPAIVSRRRVVHPLRLVPDREIKELQLRGSAQLSSFLRHRQRQSEELPPDAGPVAVEAGSRVPLLVGLVLGALLVIGSRELIRNGVPAIGQFVGIPLGRDLLHTYLTSWNGQGFGSSSPPATGTAVLGLLSSISFGWQGLLQLVLVVGLIGAGYLGAWRMLSFSPSLRARVATVAVYAAIPLPYAAIASGRWNVLAVYAATPWLIDLIRRMSGLATLDARGWGDDDIADAVVQVPPKRRLQLLAQLTLLVGIVSAFVPAFLVAVVLVAAALVAGTLIARGSHTILIGAGASAIAVVIAGLLHLPWSVGLLRAGGWDLIAGAELASPRDLGAATLAQFAIGPAVLTPLTLGLYLAVLAAPIVSRGWRLTWSARAGALAAGGLLIAVLDDQGTLPVRLPEAGILLVPVACGLAIGGGCVVAAFEHDIRGARFGWRQPLGLAVGLGLVIGLLPGLVAPADGRWSAQTITFNDYLQQLPPDEPTEAGEAGGDYRILFIGEPRSLPAPGREVAPGIAYALADDGGVVLDDLWPAEETRGDDLTVEALDAMSSYSTSRVGRLLGPLGIRFIVVPVDDGTAPRGEDPPPVPDGLVEALSAQLDLRLVDSPDKLVIYENTSWLPVRSVLDTTAVTASNEASAAVRVASPLGTGAPVFVGVPPYRVASQDVPAGTVNVSAPLDSGWELRVNGTTIEPRAAFGWSVAWDLPAGGSASLERVPPSGRRIAVAVQLVLWLAVILVARGLVLARTSMRRIDVQEPAGGPVLDLDLLDRPPGAPQASHEDLDGDGADWSDLDAADTDPSTEGRR